MHAPGPAWAQEHLISSKLRPLSNRIHLLPRDRELTCTLVQEVSKETAHDSLVTDHKDILLSLQLHDDWLQALHQILVGLKQKSREVGIESRRQGPHKKQLSMSWSKY